MEFGFKLLAGHFNAARLGIFNPKCFYNSFDYAGQAAIHYDSLWLPYGIGQAIIFLPCDFYLLSIFFFPRLMSAVGDWMSTVLR